MKKRIVIALFMVLVALMMCSSVTFAGDGPIKWGQSTLKGKK